MTSEVALLNRSAVALAADSATTVTYWEKDHFETRYFKGTNKIFHLSTVHPVGIMIYAAANLQGAPSLMTIFLPMRRIFLITLRPTSTFSASQRKKGNSNPTLIRLLHV
jgi:hypothetical protein